MDLIADLPYDIGVECLVRIPYHSFSSVASVCKSWKHQIGLPEFWALKKAAGLTRKVIVLAQARFDSAHKHGIKNFIAAPVYRLTAFEPETGYWAELPPIPGEYSDGLPVFCQLVGVGRNLVVMGGWDPVTWEVLNVVYVYDFVSATWRRGADMPGCRRSFFACASDSDRTVFVAGGHDCEKRALKSAMVYDVARDEWVQLPDMKRERDECKGAFLRGKFQVIGGYCTGMQGEFETSADVFDVVTQQWLSVKEDVLESAMCPRNCVDDGDERLYVCRDADLAMLEGAAWQVICKLPGGVRNMEYMTAWQGKVLVIGNERFGSPHQAYLLDLKSKEWEKMEAEEDFCGHVQSGCCLEL